MILATVSERPQFFRDVHSALAGRLALEAAWELQYDDVARLRNLPPDKKFLLIIDLQNLSRALAVAAALESHRQIAAIAAHGDGSREELVALMQAGFRHVVPHFSPAEILETTVRAAGKLQVVGPDQSGELYAFLPAKPGCGATTLAT